MTPFCCMSLVISNVSWLLRNTMWAGLLTSLRSDACTFIYEPAVLLSPSALSQRLSVWMRHSITCANWSMRWVWSCAVLPSAQVYDAHAMGSSAFRRRSRDSTGPPQTFSAPSRCTTQCWRTSRRPATLGMQKRMLSQSSTTSRQAQENTPQPVSLGLAQSSCILLQRKQPKIHHPYRVWLLITQIQLLSGSSWMFGQLQTFSPLDAWYLDLLVMSYVSVFWTASVPLLFRCTLFSSARYLWYCFR